MTRKRVLFVWPEDHNVWRGYFTLFDEHYDQQIVLYTALKTDVKAKRPIKLLQGSLFRIPGLRSVVDEFKPDIIIAYHIYHPTTWQVMREARRQRVPCIILESMHVPPLAWMRRPKLLVPLLFKLFAWLPRVIYNTALVRRGVRLFCMTERSAQYMRGLGYKHVEYGLIPYAQFYAAPPKPAKRAKKFTLLYVGRFTEMKNVPLLLETFAACKRDGSISSTDFTCSLIGGGDNEHALVLQRIRELDLSDIVTFTPNLPHAQLKERYQAADLFVLPSTDVLGAVVVESLENRLPVLISRNSGFSTLMQPYAKHLIFEHNNADDLKRKLLWCIAHRAQLPAMGKALAKHFSVEEEVGRKRLVARIDNLTH